jgi:hypothetical protein
MKARYFEYFDFFGQEVSFNINGARSVRSLVGGIIGIILIGLIIGATWTLGKDIIVHEQPSVLIQDVLYTKRPEMNLNKTSFPISIAMQDMDNNVYYIPNYFNFSVELKEVNNDQKTITTKYYQLENCTNDNFPGADKSQLEKAGVFNYFCIKDQNLTISGYWDEPFLRFLVIRLMYCQGENCAPREEIRNFLKTNKFTWNIYAINSLIDTADFSDPTKFYVLNIYRMTQLSIVKIHEIYLQFISIITDAGIIFEDYNENVSVAFDYDRLDSTTETDDGSIYDFYIFASKRKTVYKRKYLKIQALAANAGGIIKFLLLFGNFFTYVFNIHKLNVLIANNCFDNSKPIKIQSNKKISNHTINSPQMKSKILKSNLSDDNPIIEQYLKTPSKNINLKKPNSAISILETVKIKRNEFKFSSWDVVKKYLGCSKNAVKFKIYKKFSDLIKEDLNILSIINKLDEVRRLKNTISSNDDLKKFYDSQAKRKYYTI